MEITQTERKDLDALADAFFRNLEYDPRWEYGSIGVDPKRPFGNSDVEGDILEIIGAVQEGNDGFEKCWSSDQREYAAELYQGKLVPYLREMWYRLKSLDA